MELYDIDGNAFTSCYDADGASNPAAYDIEGNAIVLKENIVSPYLPLTEGTQASKVSRQLNQCIAYNGTNMFEFGAGTCYYNGTQYSITNGHGNNCNFGSTLHGDYPYLYCPHWDQGDGDITVNSFDGSAFSVVRTISTTNDSSYLNAYIDEPNDIIYCIIADAPRVGNITFRKVCLSTGETISERELGYTMQIIQGLAYYDGVILVSAGFGTTDPTYPNYIYALDTDGNLIARNDVTGLEEIEGVAIVNGRLIVATLNYIYTWDAAE